MPGYFNHKGRKPFLNSFKFLTLILTGVDLALESLSNIHEVIYNLISILSMYIKKMAMLISFPFLMVTFLKI